MRPHAAAAALAAGGCLAGVAQAQGEVAEGQLSPPGALHAGLAFAAFCYVVVEVCAGLAMVAGGLVDWATMSDAQPAHKALPLQEESDAHPQTRALVGSGPASTSKPTPRFTSGLTPLLRLALNEDLRLRFSEAWRGKVLSNVRGAASSLVAPGFCLSLSFFVLYGRLDFFGGGPFVLAPVGPDGQTVLLQGIETGARALEDAREAVKDADCMEVDRAHLPLLQVLLFGPVSLGLFYLGCLLLFGLLLDGWTSMGIPGLGLSLRVFAPPEVAALSDKSDRLLQVLDGTERALQSCLPPKSPDAEIIKEAFEDVNKLVLSTVSRLFNSEELLPFVKERSLWLAAWLLGWIGLVNLLFAHLDMVAKSPCLSVTAPWPLRTTFATSGEAVAFLLGQWLLVGALLCVLLTLGAWRVVTSCCSGRSSSLRDPWAILYLVVVLGLGFGYTLGMSMASFVEEQVKVAKGYLSGDNSAMVMMLGMAAYRVYQGVRPAKGDVALTTAAVAGQAEKVDLPGKLQDSREKVEKLPEEVKCKVQQDVGQLEAAVAPLQKAVKVASLRPMREETRQQDLRHGREREVRKNLAHIAFHGTFEELEDRLLSLDFDDINEVGDGSTALVNAAYKGNVEMVRLLLLMGADTSARDGYDSTALAWAAVGRERPEQYHEICRLLVRSGADLGAESRGNTPLQWARLYEKEYLYGLLGEGDPRADPKCR